MSFIRESRRKLSLALQEAAKTQSSTSGQSEKSTSSSEDINNNHDNNMDVIACEIGEHSQVAATLDQSIDSTVFDRIAETFDPDMFLSNIDEAGVFNNSAEPDPNVLLVRHDHVDRQMPQFVDVTFCEDFPSTPLEPADETEEVLQATRILQKMVELNDEKAWKSLNFEQAENDSKANHVTRNAPETETGNICLSNFSNFVAPAPYGLKDNPDQEQILQSDTWLLPHLDLTLPTTRPSSSGPNESASGNYQPDKNLHILVDSNVNVSSAEVGKKKKSKKILSPSSLFRKREQNRQRSKAYRERKKLELENLKLQVMVATREATEVKKQMIKMKKREPLRN